ncbi:ferredoxin reductase [soil metagenome]
MTTLLPRPNRANTRSPGAGLLRRTAALQDNALLNSLAWPHGVGGYRDAFRPGAGAGSIAAVIEAVTPRTDRADSLTLRPEQPMTFAAGQHVLLTCEVDGARQTRCYSLSDTPHRRDGCLEVTVAHLPDGLVSSHLTQSVRVGETVGLSAPQGHRFILPSTRPKQVLLIGGGSGITPLRSMWRTLQAEGFGDRVRVLYYARTAADAIFADELADIDGATIVTTREGEGVLSGRFIPSHLTGLDLDPAASATYVCGPVGLVDAVRDHWTSLGLDEQLSCESFAPPVAPSDPSAAGGILTFAKAGATHVNTGATLLDEAEAAGLTPQAGCRMGICHTCITVKHAGVVKDVRTGACDDGGQGEIQLCISQAVGDVQLDL